MVNNFKYITNDEQNYPFYGLKLKDEKFVPPNQDFIKVAKLRNERSCL